MIVILGPTASGKTNKAVGLAKELNGEIISADSRQVYKEMNLGTGKDLNEYGKIPYHLIDICEPGEKYNLHRFIKDFQKAYDKIKISGRQCIVCGGSGMYLENAISGIVLPEVPQNHDLRNQLSSLTLTELTQILKTYKTLHNITDVDTPKRAVRAIEIEEYYKEHPEEAIKANKKFAQPLDTVLIGIEITRDERRERISSRLRQRLEDGMVEEVRRLLEKGLTPQDLIYYGLEYKFLTLYVTGKISYEEMVAQLETAIHQFSKRQMTWFRGMEKRGFKINWLRYDLPIDDFNREVLKII